LNFARIVEITCIPKASAHRLLRELVELSALTFDPDTRKYRGGLLLARIGASITGQYDLRTMARPFLQALHNEFGHVATLGIRNDDTGIYIDKIEATDFGLRLHSEIGKRFPLHCTAMGKVLLSHADSPVIRRVLNRKLEAFTGNTITSSTQLRKELQQIRAQGYAVDNEEHAVGLRCVAATIYDEHGEPLAAISISGPSSRILDRRVTELGLMVAHTAAQMTEAMGGRMPTQQTNKE